MMSRLQQLSLTEIIRLCLMIFVDILTQNFVNMASDQIWFLPLSKTLILMSQIFECHMSKSMGLKLPSTAQKTLSKSLLRLALLCKESRRFADACYRDLIPTLKSVENITHESTDFRVS